MAKAQAGSAGAREDEPDEGHGIRRDEAAPPGEDALPAERQEAHDEGELSEEEGADHREEGCGLRDEVGQ